jgi:hypothetical protein
MEQNLSYLVYMLCLGVIVTPDSNLACVRGEMHCFEALYVTAKYRVKRNL